MRLIDADTLMEKVERIQPWDAYLGKYAQGIRHCMEIVSFLIKDAPTIESSAQPEQKWIPCSERLPETDEFVLASLSGRYKNIRFEHACEIADYADNEWFINAYPHMTAEIANDLIEAWMPLPEPYMKGVTTT